MGTRRNFYRILHVQPDAPTELIRMSYRTLMQGLKRHPDLGGDHGEAALINEAFATLRDPVKRSAYDRTLATVAETAHQGNGHTGHRPTSAHSGAGAPPPRRSAETPHPIRGADKIPLGHHACPFCGERHAVQDARRPDAVCWCCRSPLFPAVKQPRTAGSGRSFERTPRTIAVRIHLAGRDARTFDGTTEDISITGALVTSAVELAVGQRLKLDCDFCMAVGVVRHVRPVPDFSPRWHAGVEFLTLLIKQSRGAFVSTHV